MRLLSIGAQSNHVFITNHGGIGNEHLEPTVGESIVEYLNNLLVRLMVKYGN